MTKSVIYIGCHTDERNEDGSPVFKSESVFDVDMPYCDAVKLLRGLNDIVKKLLAFRITGTQERSWKDLLKS